MSLSHFTGLYIKNKVEHGQKCLHFTTLRLFVCSITSKRISLAPQPKRHKERIRWIQGGREWQIVPKGGRERGRDIICWKWMAERKVELCISVWPVRFNPALSLYSESLLSDVLSKLPNYLHGNPTLQWPTLHLSLCVLVCGCVILNVMGQNNCDQQWWDSQSKWVSDMIKSNHSGGWLDIQQFRLKVLLDYRTWKA